MGNAVEHGLGKEVVAALHHRAQHLAEQSGAQAQLAWLLLWGYCGSFNGDAFALQALAQCLGEVVFALYEQRRERRVVVVPAPAVAPSYGVFEADVGDDASADGDDASADGLDAQLLHAVDKLVHVGVAEERIHGALAYDVALQCGCAVNHFANGRERGREDVVGSQQVEGSYGSDHFLR